MDIVIIKKKIQTLIDVDALLNSSRDQKVGPWAKQQKKKCVMSQWLWASSLALSSICENVFHT
jgi:hypothetical protein